MSRCTVCSYEFDNCTVCVGADYDFENANAGFLHANSSSYSTCVVDCDPSSSPDTVVGYYGSIKTMVCYPCPSPCSNCNIQMIRDAYPILVCDDNLCSNGLVCTSCLAGFVLESGQC